MPSEKWIKLSERQPPYEKLVYTKDDQGQIGAYTRYQHPNLVDGWTSLISTDNNAIVEWLEQYHADELQGVCVYCGEIQQYESLEQKSGEEGNRLRVDHIKQCTQRPELKLIAELERLMETHQEQAERLLREKVDLQSRLKQVEGELDEALSRLERADKTGALMADALSSEASRRID